MEIRKIKRNKPRIVLVIDTWFPVHTGEQVYSAKLAKALAGEGYEVDVLTRAIKGRLSTEHKALEKESALRVKKFGFPSHPWNVLMQILYVMWVFFYLLVKGKRYHLYHAQSGTSAFAMKAASWFTRVPTVLTVHAHHVFDRTWTLKKIVHRVMFLETRYSQEISISEHFLKAVNVNERVLVIPYGVDTEPFDAVPVERAPQQFNVLYVGRMDIQKGVDLLIQAAQKVIESNGFIQSQKDFSLHLVGEGPDRKYFEALTKKAGIEKYVRFYGLLMGEDLTRLYKSCDLFVLPSRVDALPLALLEACAARLPILASSTGDLRHLVLENVNGHLFEPEDVEELAYYIELFAGNPHLEKLGEASYDLVRQEYQWEQSLQKTLRVYENLIAEKEVKGLRAHQHRWFWSLPLLFWRAREARKEYHGKTPLRFCLTTHLSPPSLSKGSPNDFTEVSGFLERFSEFCSTLELPATVFVPTELLEALQSELQALQEGGHEIGLSVSEKDWLTPPLRKSTLRFLQDERSRLSFEKLHHLRVPFEESEQDLEWIHEAGFETLPVSEDPWPHVEFHFGLPFARVYKMNLKSFLKRPEKELLASINRLRAHQKAHGLMPYLIFECDRTEFQSREDMDYANGENFTLLAKKLTFLQEHMPLEFMTLSGFCKSCSIAVQ